MRQDILELDEKARVGSKSGPHKKRAHEPEPPRGSSGPVAAQEGRERPPLAWSLYLGLAALFGVLALASATEGFFFLALAFTALAEITLMRRALEFVGDRARRRMEFPPCEPPLREGASPEEAALAWASIACRASELGQWARAAMAWQECERALRSFGEVA